MRFCEQHKQLVNWRCDPLDHHDRLFTEDDDADADTYDSDASAAAYGGDEL